MIPDLVARLAARLGGTAEDAAGLRRLSKGALAVLHLDDRSGLVALERLPPSDRADQPTGLRPRKGRDPGAGGMASGSLCGLTGGMSARTLVGGGVARWWSYRTRP